MTVIQLLKQLFEYTTSDNISEETKTYLESIKKENQKLELGTDPEKQKKMIALFLGGIIYALDQEEKHQRYHSNYGFKLYNGDAIDIAYEKLQKRGVTAITEKMLTYNTGYLVLETFPQNFSDSNDFSELLDNEYQLIRTQPGSPVPVFPNLQKNLAKVNRLIKFCIEHKDNLEVPELDLLHDESPHHGASGEFPHDQPHHNQPPLEFKDFVAEFRQRHEESYKSGFLGGLFNRTNLEPYDSLTPDKILQHAKKHTFFGFKNRTCTILEDMKILDKDGNLLQDSVRQNKFK